MLLEYTRDKVVEVNPVQTQSTKGSIVPSLEKPSDSPKTNQEKAIGFEPEDKPTPTAGKFLLILMAILLIFLGYHGLRDIENLPTKPERISYCAGKVTYYSKSRTCSYSKYEKKYDIPLLFLEANQIAQQKDGLQKQKTGLTTKISQLNKTKQDRQREYDLSLQEIMADETKVGLTSDQLRAQIQSLENQIADQNSGLSSLNSKIAGLDSQLNIANENLENVAEKARADWKKDDSIYKLWVFLIQAIFVFPLFFVFLRLYLRLKAKDSPHTIIATTLVGVSGLFVVSVTLRYLGGTFLATLLEAIAGFLKNFPIFRTLLFYLGMLLVIVIFGGAVYLLQKKIFNPARVRLRRLRAHKCPFCEFPFDFSKSYCPSCGKQLMEKCSKCTKEKYTVMKHCPNCGFASG